MPTKRTFEEVAKIIKRRNDQLEREKHNIPANLLINYVANDLADFFARENTNFNRDKFIEACGM